MLLDWLGGSHANGKYNDAAKAIDQAVDAALQNTNTRTRDPGGTLGTRAHTEHLLKSLYVGGPFSSITLPSGSLM